VLIHGAVDVSATLTESPFAGCRKENVESDEAAPAGIPFTNHWKEGLLPPYVEEAV
jgi:hypothetical protein